MTPVLPPPINKPWGRYYPLYHDERCEIARIEVVRGGFCSIHRHERKDNRFVLVSGVLRIVNYVAGVRLHSVMLTAGDEWLEPAGREHRFEAVEDSVAIEIYTLAPGFEKLGVGEEDIIRRGKGGVWP